MFIAVVVWVLVVPVEVSPAAPLPAVVLEVETDGLRSVIEGEGQDV